MANQHHDANCVGQEGQPGSIQASHGSDIIVVSHEGIGVTQDGILVGQDGILARPVSQYGFVVNWNSLILSVDFLTIPEDFLDLSSLSSSKGKSSQAIGAKLVKSSLRITFPNLAT